MLTVRFNKGHFLPLVRCKLLLSIDQLLIFYNIAQIYYSGHLLIRSYVNKGQLLITTRGCYVNLDKNCMPF